MKLIMNFLWISFAIIWLLPAQARRSVVERKLYSMNQHHQIVAQTVQAPSKSPVDFSGYMRLRAIWSANAVSAIPMLNESFKGGWTGKVNDQTGWGFRLASKGLTDGLIQNYLAENTSDQPLGSVAIVGLDTAYISYQINPSFQLILGEMDNPYFNSHSYNLIWDEDITPGGVHLSYQKAFSSRYQLSWQASALVFGSYLEKTVPIVKDEEENETKPNQLRSDSLIQSYMFATSGLIEMDYGDFMLSGGIGFYEMKPSSDQEQSKSILDIALKMKLKNFWIPFSASAQLLQNFESDRDNFGAVLGVMVSDISPSWEASYHFFQLSSETAFTSLLDSDIFAGLNQSSRSAFVGIRGHRLVTRYFFNHSLSVEAKYILSTSPPGADPINHSVFTSVHLRI